MTNGRRDGGEVKCEHVWWHLGSFRFFVRVCGSCGEWLPLGPATITPEVEIEIRAAELAANNDGDGWVPFELDGLVGFDAVCDVPMCSGCEDISLSPTSLSQYQAGYLAAAILDEEK